MRIHKNILTFIAICVSLNSCVLSHPQTDLDAPSGMGNSIATTESIKPGFISTETIAILSTLPPTISSPNATNLTEADTPFPTWTPLPTLENYSQIVVSLMTDNAGCQLPCWWGITPGETSWQEAKQFLQQFAFITTRGGSLSQHVETEPYIVYHWNPGTDDSNGTLIDVRNGIVQLILFSSETARFRFQLNQILTDYGIPDKVTVHDERRLLVVYDSQRFVALFQLESSHSNNQTEACIPGGPYIYTWAPGEVWLNEYIGIGNQRVSSKYKSIEEETGMDIVSFYERFLTSPSNYCFEFE